MKRVLFLAIATVFFSVSLLVESAGARHGPCPSNSHPGCSPPSTSPVFEFRSPFVDLVLGGVVTLPGGTVSVSGINNRGDWTVVTADLMSETEYEICLDAATAPTTPIDVQKYLPLRLAKRESDSDGNFFATGNILDKQEVTSLGDLVGVSFQLYEDLAGTCACGQINNDKTISGCPPDPTQESGIAIAIGGP